MDNTNRVRRDVADLFNLCSKKSSSFDANKDERVLEALVHLFLFIQ